MFVCRATDDYYILLLGETGSGKSTFLNMLVNFFRGPQEARKLLPKKKDIRLAVPTAFLEATEPEASKNSERSRADSAYICQQLFSCCSVNP